MAASLYLLVVLLPCVLGQCAVKKTTPLFGRAVYEFSMDLIQRLGHETENHFVASPLSLWTILSTLSLGADGITLTELNKILRRTDVNCIERTYSDILLLRGVTSATNETTLERSSTVFVDNNLPVTELYRKIVNRTGVCGIMFLPFGNLQIAASAINDYVRRVTHDNIQEVVSPNDIEGVLLILIDAIYFKGAWSHPFDPSRTELNAPFYDESGKHVGYVNMMHGLIPLQTIAIDPIQAKVLELPYGAQDRFSMLIFVPYSNNTVAGVMDLLKHVTIRSIFSSLNEFPEDSVEVRIPRFTISSDLDNLKELLVGMGLKTMFDSSLAQFPFISDTALFVSNVLQKAEIKVTEVGTEASAASAMEMTSRNLPEQFFVNKPFMYMIVDKHLNIPLFIGAYSKPSTF
ncbi:hypothetical protein MSG28_012879 [Choristoneura fumiferana]|uniref:Uncharacterized protein n=1 Tax=Choristoneura fumiferana TaxID=7141 RepID=A0ACC0JI97_CHOFU|nr:hypothetical protein MSG28_012879 [Choristoneura fumiferana]